MRIVPPRRDAGTITRPESWTGLGRALRDGRERAAPWVERLGRVGYAAKGNVYLLVGVLAAEAAIGVAGGAATGSRGALRHARRLPFGDVLLVAIAAGLAGYVLWRLVQTIRDTERKGRSPAGIIVRLGYAISGAIHGVLAWTALELVQGHRPRGDEALPHEYTARLLSLPHGPWLVCAVGAVVIGVAVAQGVIAVRAAFVSKLDPLSSMARAWITWLGRLGYVARGVVLFIIGGFLISAGIHANPRDARGLGGALHEIARQPEGRWLFGAVAVGLAAYGVFMLLLARCRRMVVR
jgi:hypothetical protein